MKRQARKYVNLFVDYSILLLDNVRITYDYSTINKK